MENNDDIMENNDDVIDFYAETLKRSFKPLQLENIQASSRHVEGPHASLSLHVEEPFGVHVEEPLEKKVRFNSPLAAIRTYNLEDTYESELDDTVLLSPDDEESTPANLFSFYQYNSNAEVSSPNNDEEQVVPHRYLVETASHAMLSDDDKSMDERLDEKLDRYLSFEEEEFSERLSSLGSYDDFKSDIEKRFGQGSDVRSSQEGEFHPKCVIMANTENAALFVEHILFSSSELQIDVSEEYQQDVFAFVYYHSFSYAIGKLQCLLMTNAKSSDRRTPLLSKTQSFLEKEYSSPLTKIRELGEVVVDRSLPQFLNNGEQVVNNCIISNPVVIPQVDIEREKSSIPGNEGIVDNVEVNQKGMLFVGEMLFDLHSSYDMEEFEKTNIQEILQVDESKTHLVEEQTIEGMLHDLKSTQIDYNQTLPVSQPSKESFGSMPLVDQVGQTIEGMLHDLKSTQIDYNPKSPVSRPTKETFCSMYLVEQAGENTEGMLHDLKSTQMDCNPKSPINNCDSMQLVGENVQTFHKMQYDCNIDESKLVLTPPFGNLFAVPEQDSTCIQDESSLNCTLNELGESSLNCTLNELHHSSDTGFSKNEGSLLHHDRLLSDNTKFERISQVNSSPSLFPERSGPLVPGKQQQADSCLGTFDHAEDFANEMKSSPFNLDEYLPGTLEMSTNNSHEISHLISSVDDILSDLEATQKRQSSVNYMLEELEATQVRHNEHNNDSKVSHNESNKESKASPQNSVFVKRYLVANSNYRDNNNNSGNNKVTPSRPEKYLGETEEQVVPDITHAASNSAHLPKQMYDGDNSIPFSHEPFINTYLEVRTPQKVRLGLSKKKKNKKKSLHPYFKNN